jgi:hypothetical protein
LLEQSAGGVMIHLLSAGNTQPKEAAKTYRHHPFPAHKSHRTLSSLFELVRKNDKVHAEDVSTYGTFSAAIDERAALNIAMMRMSQYQRQNISTLSHCKLIIRQ